MKTVYLRCTRRAAAGAVLASAALLMTACSSAGASSAGAASPAVAAAHTAPRVYLAEGQDIRGTAVYKPACRSGCALSGDSTAFLAEMKWTKWNGSQAVGKGIYELNACDPNCAAGPVFNVPVVVTLSHPVKACSSKGTRWFWSRASFRFPAGLPKALRGDNAPENPWTFSSLIDAARQSCARR